MKEEIFRISKNIVRAKALRDMASERLKDIKNEEKPYKIVEQYYEVIKELITAIMYSEGFKTLSHIALIEYLKENHSKPFNGEEFITLDEIRRLRNDILYYGKKVDDIYLKNKEEKLKAIINKLFEISDSIAF